MAKEDEIIKEIVDMLRCVEYLKIIENITDEEINKVFDCKIKRTEYLNIIASKL